MKKLLRKIGLYLLNKKFVYTDSFNDKETIILSDRELSDRARYGIGEELRQDETGFMKKLKIRKALLETLNKHKGTVEDGKCFLASDLFVLGVDKNGKVKPIVDCNTPAK